MPYFVASITNFVVTKLEGAKPLILKLAIGHESEPVQSRSHPHIPHKTFSERLSGDVSIPASYSGDSEQ
jgi:hypothetical protein